MCGLDNPLTEAPGRMKVLSTTLSVVYAIEARVSAPTPSRAAAAGDCWPNGPRLSDMATVRRERIERVTCGTK